MLSVPLLVERLICTVEGGAGTMLNIILFIQLIRTRMRGNDKLYRYPIYVSSVQGFIMSLIVTVMCYGHILRERSLIVASVGPLFRFFPIWLCDWIMLVAWIVISMMWTLIPTTSILQYISLSRSHWSTIRRLTVSFSFVTVTTIYISTVLPGIIPTPLFREWMDNQTREVFQLEDDVVFLTHGITLEHAQSNNNRSLMPILIHYACIPYLSSYMLFTSLAFLIRRRILSFGHGFSKKTLHMQKAFFTMQILQGFLPLAILSIPFTTFLTGSLLSWNLDMFSILLTLFIWLCPIAQAAVQLRFVSQSSSKSPEATNSMSRTSVVVIKPRRSGDPQ